MPKELAQDEGAQPSDTLGLPPFGSSDRAALERCAKAAWLRVASGAALPDEAWTHFLTRVWATHADRIRAAHAHEASPL